jgi:hypothetical protein
MVIFFEVFTLNLQAIKDFGEYQSNKEILDSTIQLKEICSVQTLEI